MSLGIRSGVNWMRLNAHPLDDRERPRDERLAEPGRALDERVALREHRDEHPLDELLLPDDDARHLLLDALEGLLELVRVQPGGSPIPCPGMAAEYTEVRSATPPARRPGAARRPWPAWRAPRAGWQASSGTRARTTGTPRRRPCRAACAREAARRRSGRRPSARATRPRVRAYRAPTASTCSAKARRRGGGARARARHPHARRRGTGRRPPRAACASPDPRPARSSAAIGVDGGDTPSSGVGQPELGPVGVREDGHHGRGVAGPGEARVRHQLVGGDRRARSRARATAPPRRSSRRRTMRRGPSPR